MTCPILAVAAPTLGAGEVELPLMDWTEAHTIVRSKVVSRGESMMSLLTCSIVAAQVDFVQVIVSRFARLELAAKDIERRSDSTDVVRRTLKLLSRGDFPPNSYDGRHGGPNSGNFCSTRTKC